MFLQKQREILGERIRKIQERSRKLLRANAKKEATYTKVQFEIGVGELIRYVCTHYICMHIRMQMGT